jgi:hypothetical protein
MSRDWKTGDVALVEAGRCWADRRVGLRLVEGWSTVNGVNVDGDGVVNPIRLLVVIDPESPEDVARLADAFCNARWSHLPGSDECDPLTRSSMQAALRELANPKPDEPTGLGAVVEDAAGDTWVRWTLGEPPKYAPWRHSDATGQAAHRKYDQIDVVRVLHEGVPS